MKTAAVTPGRLVALAAAALLAELLLMADFGRTGARPDLPLVIVCFAALGGAGRSPVWGTAWTIGLARDALSAGPLGLHALLYLAVAWVLSELRLFMLPGRFLGQALVSGAAAGATSLAAGAVACALAGGIPLGTVIGRSVLAAGLTAVAAPPLAIAASRAAPRRRR